MLGDPPGTRQMNHQDKLAADLAHRVLTGWLPRRSGMDGTILGKTGHLGIAPAGLMRPGGPPRNNSLNGVKDTCMDGVFHIETWSIFSTNKSDSTLNFTFVCKCRGL